MQITIEVNSVGELADLVEFLLQLKQGALVSAAERAASSLSKSSGKLSDAIDEQTDVH